MNLKEQVYAALMSSRELTSRLVKDRKGRCIYPGQSPDAGSYPILVYNIISDVPALVADGEEMERRVTVRIHILTRDGHYGEIYSALQKVMLRFGFMRGQTVEITEKDLFILCVDYKIGTGVDL
jgi:hypothetical protein